MRLQWSLILAALITMAVMVMGGCGGSSGDGNSGTGGSTSYVISGNVSENGFGLAGVTVSLSGNSTATNVSDSNGNYTFTTAQNGSYTLTPTKIGYTFTPSILVVTVTGANLTGKLFTATANSNGTTIGTVQLPKTGQTVSYATGDDGALQKGVAWPNPRFIDNANGTVTDNLTDLIWLKNANCFSTQNWTAALISANVLASGACGLTDGSTVGQWRLPNINELESLVDISRYNPALPAGHPFTSVQSGIYYWSSSSVQNTNYASSVILGDGYIGYNSKGSTSYVWPVRAGQ